MAYALLHFFHLDTCYGFYLQMVLAPQELVMGAPLVIAGFNLDAVRNLVVDLPNSCYTAPENRISDLCSQERVLSREEIGF